MMLAAFMLPVFVQAAPRWRVLFVLAASVTVLALHAQLYALPRFDYNALHRFTAAVPIAAFLVLLVPAHATDAHLQILADVATRFDDADFRAMLRACTDAEAARLAEVVKLVAAAEPDLPLKVSLSPSKGKAKSVRYAGDFHVQVGAFMSQSDAENRLGMVQQRAVDLAQQLAQPPAQCLRNPA